MKKNNFLYIGIAAASIVIVVSIIFGFSNSPMPAQTKLFPELDLTYPDINLKLKESLGSESISMSSAVKLGNPEDIKKFCSFFDDENMQKQVEYCTSTELRNSDGNFLGNIHLVGSKDKPKIILAVIQTDPFMKNIDDIKSVFRVVVKDLVCDCWDDLKPSNIGTVDEWVDKQREFHTSDTKPTSKSTLSINGYDLKMEMTTNTQGYLWKLIITK